MSSVLSNSGLYVPSLSSTRMMCNPHLKKGFSSPQLVSLGGRNLKCDIKAMAPENRENLDHLQKSPNKQLQSQPRRSSAPIGLWDRFPTARTVGQMMDTMDRLMEDRYGGSRWDTPVSSEILETGYNRGRTPWEIKEKEGEYKMRFDMPGMRREDVKVWIEEKMLVVKAEKSSENVGEGGDDHEWSAKSYGRYSYRIALPESIQFEKIKAEVKDGVLYISVPKNLSVGKVMDIHVK